MSPKLKRLSGPEVVAVFRTIYRQATRFIDVETLRAHFYSD